MEVSGAGGSDVGRGSETPSRRGNDNVGETERITEAHSASHGRGVERKQPREVMEADLSSGGLDGGCDEEMDIGVGSGNASHVETGAGAATETGPVAGARIETDDTGCGTRAGSSTEIPTRTTHDDITTSQNMSPLPSYAESLSVFSRPSSTPRIQPREDEGNETLPSYSCSIKIAAVFHRKMELDSAVHRARDRNWYQVFVELQGTALRIYKCKTTGVFQTMRNKNDPDMPAWMKAGELVRSYTLQHGDVGIAADYQKRRYVIRLRVETDQFLLSCIELHTFVAWLELLSASISLSPPLDQRTVPPEYSLPRRRRRCAETQVAAVNNNNPVTQQRANVRGQTPHLAAEMDGGRGGRSRAASEPMLRRVSVNPATGTLSRAASAMPSSSSSTLSLAPSQACHPRSCSPTPAPCSSSSSSSVLPSTSASTPATTPLGPNPSISSTTGKWSPEQTWTPLYDLLYAKRCMAILLRKSPRKTNFVIVKDREFLIDWDSGRVTRCAPPEYGELGHRIGRGHGGGWAIGKGGILVRAN